MTTRSEDGTAASPPGPAVPSRAARAGRQWVTLVDGTPGTDLAGPPLRMRRVFLQLVGAAVVVLAVVAVGGAYASRGIAEREAVSDAAVRPTCWRSRRCSRRSRTGCSPVGPAPTPRSTRSSAAT